MMMIPSSTPRLALICALLAALAFSPVRTSAQEDELSRLYPPAYVQVLQQAIRSFLARDFDVALKKLAEADRMFPDTVYALNVRGAIAIERKQMEEGAKYCKEALAKDPKFFPARFNLAEIPFAEKRYAESRKGFQDLLDEDPKNELLQYRVFMTYLLEGDMVEAKKVLEEIPFPSNTAAYYYAHGAWEFAHGNPEKGKEWVRSGDWVFPRQRNTNFADVMYDLGWLQRDVPTAE